MTDLQRRLFNAFEGEYRSILEGLRAILSEIEGGRAPDGQAIADAFRLAHTLKGSAHVVGFPVVVTLAHRMESLFAQVRDGKVSIGNAEVRLIHSVLGAVEDQVVAHGQPNQPDAGPVIAQLDARLNGTVAPAPTAQPPASAPAPLKLVDAAPVRESDSVRLNARHLDQLLGTAGSLLTVIRNGRQVDLSIGNVSRRIDALAREWDLLRQSSGGALQKINGTPELARIAQFLETIGDELRPLSKRIRGARDESRQNEWELRHLGEQLQDDAARARLVPAETVWGGFAKMVRDLAGELKREIDFRFSGLDVEADRIVLQSLKDPLMHILRNAAGHGLEDREVRLAAGKDPVGRLTVKLAAENGRLRLEIADDGAGLDLERIRRRAVDGGFIDQAAADLLSDDDVRAYIFRPGLSTAPAVTDLAGRGIGMSVVAEAIARLRGAISVTSESGLGTTFVISVPIALANHRVILIDAGEQTYAIPCGAVHSLRRTLGPEVRMVRGRPHLTIEDRPTPYVPLGAMLGTVDGDEGERRPTVVLENDGQRVAFGVTRILDEREAMIKNLGPVFNRHPIYAGAVIESDGRVALLLSVPQLIARARGDAKALAVPTAAPVAKTRGPLRILVVDDSITTRTLEKGILESSGHQVTLAVDGMDALAKLQLDTFDLVISDLEMPRLDGFGLVGEIKKHPVFRRIPVIMVTSRERPEDRARGLGLGASAYVLKQKFDQGDLLETIRRVV